MSIRNTAKALIVHEGKVLLNRCKNPQGGIYYTLPGGGQHLCEALHEAVVRECLEESGYRVTPLRLAAVCESIESDPEFVVAHPDYTHRMYFVFLCRLEEGRDEPTEKDSSQEESEWIPLENVAEISLFPTALHAAFFQVIEGTSPVYLGAHTLP